MRRTMQHLPCQQWCTHHRTDIGYLPVAGPVRQVGVSLPLRSD